VVAPGLDGAFSLVGSFVSGRHSLRNYFVFSKKRIKPSACFVVKYDTCNDMAKVAEEMERSSVGFDIRFGSSVGEKLNVDVVLEQKN
jgi:hypothetical protein